MVGHLMLTPSANRLPIAMPSKEALYFQWYDRLYHRRLKNGSGLLAVIAKKSLLSGSISGRLHFIAENQKTNICFQKIIYMIQSNFPIHQQSTDCLVKKIRQPLGICLLVTVRGQDSPLNPSIRLNTEKLLFQSPITLLAISY